MENSQSPQISKSLSINITVEQPTFASNIIEKPAFFISAIGIKTIDDIALISSVTKALETFNQEKPTIKEEVINTLNQILSEGPPLTC